MKPIQPFGCLLRGLIITCAVLQACGTNHDKQSPPVACATSAILPCFLVNIEPSITAARLSLKDSNGTTTAMNWTLGQNTPGNGCIQTDPNGPFLFLPKDGAYSLAVDANGYQPAEIDFTSKMVECGSGPCPQDCLQTNPAPLQVTLTASP